MLHWRCFGRKPGERNLVFFFVTFTTCFIILVLPHIIVWGSSFWLSLPCSSSFSFSRRLAPHTQLTPGAVKALMARLVPDCRRCRRGTWRGRLGTWRYGTSGTGKALMVRLVPQGELVMNQQIFFILAMVISFEHPSGNSSKSSIFCYGVEIRFWSCNFQRFVQALKYKVVLGRALCKLLL